MGFQSEIRDSLGVAVPGVIVEAAENYKLVDHFVTEDDTCTVGGFVRQGVSEKGVVGAGGTGKVIGIIVKDKYYTGSNEGMSLPAGATVTVMLFGVIAVKNTYSASATYGDNVFLKENSDTLIFSSAETITAGATATGWKVKQGCATNGIAFITK